MSFKDALIALTTYPEPTPVSALDDAIDLAAALGAKVSAIACEVKINVPGTLLGRRFLNVPAMIGEEAKKSATNAQQLLAAFQAAAERSGVFQERILEHCLTSEVPGVLVEYSRLRDLTILPKPEGDYLEHWYAESIIFGSGRPAVVLPTVRKRTGPFALDTVIVAWDFSRPATRAVADAMPILEKAKRVNLSQ
jgi:nucleotide-binding universal stress UspA family protein